MLPNLLIPLNVHFLSLPLALERGSVGRAVWVGNVLLYL